MTNGYLYEYPSVKRNLNTEEKLISEYASSVSVIDRFGLLNPRKDFIYDRLPKASNKSLEDLCMERVSELAKTDKQLVIFSSEGVDSMAIISLFHGYGVPFRVYEFKNPETDVRVINALRKNGINYTLLEQGFDNELLKDCYIVDGNCADQLFHNASLFNEKARVIPILKDKEYLDGKYTEIMENPRLRAWLLKAPVKLTNRKEISWYISYCTKWRECQYQHLPKMLEILGGYIVDINEYSAFFGTDEFSDWAFTHCKENLSIDVNDSRLYKLPLKLITKKYLKGMDDIILNKGKKFSVFSDTREMDIPEILYTVRQYKRFVYFENGTKKIRTE